MLRYVALLALLPTVAQAGFLERCFGRVGKSVPEAARLVKDVAWYLESSTQRVMTKARSEATEASRVHAHGIPAAGSKLRVGNNEYQVKEFLGAGEEATVLLVANRGKLAVAKQMKDPDGVDKTIAGLEKLARNGVRTPQILDSNAGTLVMEYIEGAPIREMIGGGKYEELLSEKARVELDRKWQALRALAEAKGLTVYPDNVILSAKDGELYVIDPV